MGTNLSESEKTLVNAFLNLRTPNQLAKFFDIDYRKLNFYLSKGARYEIFEIPKKSGGTRRITAPVSPVKILQRKLAEVLKLIYEPRSMAHGFCADKSIVSNATMHKGKNLVLNLDLVDFFPSIHLGRVRGMFGAAPFKFPLRLANVLAMLCCYESKLPQGAPTSPIISNFICVRMDTELRNFAMGHGCVYTRYADDITFSSNRKIFPPSLVITSSGPSVELSKELISIISSHSFRINTSKTRLLSKSYRQEVTGLVVNQVVNVPRSYVRATRAILHDWISNGQESATQKLKLKLGRSVNLEKHVKGRIDFIGQVKSPNSVVYAALLKNTPS